MKILSIAHNKTWHSQVSFTSSLYYNFRDLTHGELESNKNRDKHQRWTHNQIWRINNGENGIKELRENEIAIVAAPFPWSVFPLHI